MEITKAYLARQADEITLQQADVVLVLEQEDGELRLGGGQMEVGRWGGPQRESPSSAPTRVRSMPGAGS